MATYTKRRLTPKGARGRAAVRRLGRTYKTGVFAQGVGKCIPWAKKKYRDSDTEAKERCTRIMGTQYWKQARG